MSRSSTGHTSTNWTGVRVGQIWRDNDKRSRHRRLQVCAIGADGYVICRAVLSGGLGRASTIRIDRFRPHSTGYVLESEPTP